MGSSWLRSCSIYHMQNRIKISARDAGKETLFPNSGWRMDNRRLKVKSHMTTTTVSMAGRVQCVRNLQSALRLMAQKLHVHVQEEGTAVSLEVTICSLSTVHHIRDAGDFHGLKLCLHVSVSDSCPLSRPSAVRYSCVVSVSMCPSCIR